MKIVHIIGNGFDINLGLKTKYTDFYEEYKKTESKSNLVNDLKKEISKGIVDWSDLELAFGKHTVKLNDINEFDEVYEDIVDNLGDYLIAQEDKYDFKKVNKEIFLRQLASPESALNEEDIQELNQYKEQWKNTEWSINIITLNYTRVIEKILDDQYKSVIIGAHHQFQTVLKNVLHIHGYTDERTILGVNDISQIDKKDFHENEEILEALIKTKCNRTQRHNIDKKCERLIAEADLICLFGSSIGDTDNYWWELIGDQLRRGIKIIIFKRGVEIKQRFPQKKARTGREIKKVFLDKTNLSPEERKDIESNIYVGVNTKMFNLIS